MTNENERSRPEDDVARLGLVVVGEASALHAGDDDALDASEANIRETVDSMVDEPLTDRQEEVVERLASASGTLTAGLSGALAAKTGSSVDDVLEGAARSVLWQQRLAAERDAGGTLSPADLADLADAADASDPTDASTRGQHDSEADAAAHDADRGQRGEREDAGGQQQRRGDDEGDRRT